METEWIPALIFLNHLRTCINVHTSKPNTLIDKIHKTSFNIFTSFNLFTNSDLGHSHSNMLFSKIQLTNLSVWFLCLIQEHLKEEDCCYPERKGLSKGFAAMTKSQMPDFVAHCPLDKRTLKSGGNECYVFKTHFMYTTQMKINFSD